MQSAENVVIGEQKGEEQNDENEEIIKEIPLSVAEEGGNGC